MKFRVHFKLLLFNCSHTLTKKRLLSAGCTCVVMAALLCAHKECQYSQYSLLISTNLTMKGQITLPTPYLDPAVCALLLCGVHALHLNIDLLKQYTLYWLKLRQAPLPPQDSDRSL